MSKNPIDIIPENIRKYLEKQNIKELRPSQEKSLRKGLFTNNKNQIVCSPTASGKTFVAELAMLNTLINKKKKVIYVVPLKALASEKFKEFKKLYGDEFQVKISVGEIQSEKYNYNFDILLVTSEKLDSLIRHDTGILENVGLLVVDEIHLLNDEKRGPTLEIILSIFKTKFPRIRVIGLSATIGNPKELAEWLNADLVLDDWRPVELQHYVLMDNELMRYR
jgi:helicase